MALVIDRPRAGDGLYEKLVKIYGNRNKLERGIADAIYIIRLLESPVLHPSVRFSDLLEQDSADKETTITLMWIILKTQILPNDEMELLADEVEGYIHKNGIGEHYLTECKMTVWKWMKSWRLGYIQLGQEYQKMQSDEYQKVIGQEYLRKMFRGYLKNAKKWSQGRRDKEYDWLEHLLKLEGIPKEVKDMIEALAEDKGNDRIVNVNGTYNDIHDNENVDIK